MPRPGNSRAKFHLNPQLPPHAEQWLADAKPASDSWWDHWRQWLAARSGDKRPAPETLGNADNPPQMKAPGTYVTEP